MRRFALVFAFAVSVLASALAGGAASAQALVDTAWLKQHLSDKNLVVLDVFAGDRRAEFAKAHIAGAQFTDFLGEPWRVAVAGGAQGLLPDEDAIAKHIGSFGIDNDTHVVLVPGGREKGDFNAAARVYWTFKVLGHDTVSILNGGEKAWFADPANPVASGTTQATPKRFAVHYRPELRATRAEVEQALTSKSAQLVDARPPAQYEGKAKSPAVRTAGTIPGAVNLSSASLQSADGTTLLPPSEIKALMAKAGAQSSGRQIAFCNTGHLAAGAWFVLHEVEGNKDARLYDGSMSDWASDPARPVVDRSKS